MLWSHSGISELKIRTRHLLKYNKVPILHYKKNIRETIHFKKSNLITTKLKCIHKFIFYASVNLLDALICIFINILTK